MLNSVAIVIAVMLVGSLPAHASPPETLVVDADTAVPTTGYRRGKRIKLRVVTIGWADVEVDTARAFAKMHAAAAADGIDLAIRSGFRTHEAQQWLYAAYRQGYGNPAAKPGYSNHQSGRALDIIVDSPILAWLEQHGRTFGFRATVKGEPWHWEFTPKKKKRR